MDGVDIKPGTRVRVSICREGLYQDKVGVVRLAFGGSSRIFFDFNSTYKWSLIMTDWT